MSIVLRTGASFRAQGIWSSFGRQSLTITRRTGAAIGTTAPLNSATSCFFGRSCSARARSGSCRCGSALRWSSAFSAPAPVHESAVSDGVEHAKEHARGRVEWRPAASPAALPLGDQGSL